MQKPNRDSRFQNRKRRSQSTLQEIGYCNLEPRNLLAGITLQGGTLTLEGTGGDDVFRVSQIGHTTIQVSVANGGETVFQRFSANLVDEIEVKGRSGDDFFNNATSLRSTFYGHNGNDRAFGGRASDTFFGGDGDDFFFGRQGIDSAYGWNGNDRLFGSDGNDYLDGQSGDDYLNGGNGRDQLFGGDGFDRIFGSDDSDVLDGGFGNDFISGGGGNDHLSGRQGRDVLRGESGDDELHGGDGNDLLFGGAGSDISRGGRGNDFAFDHAGDLNQIFGDQGNDILRGGVGVDEIHGGTGNDRLFGGDGDDVLYGNQNVDFLNGGRGRDGLFGGRDAADRLVGGADDDRFLVTVDQNGNASQVLDSVVDANGEDAVISFVSNLRIQTNQVFAAGTWSDAEIETVDQALRNLHLDVSTTRLLKLANGQNLTLVRLGHVTTPSGASILGLNFTDSNRIGFTDQLFDRFADRISETVYHEIGHNFDTVDENPWVTGFRAISSWDQVQHAGDRLSLDGQWYYNDSFDNFLRTNARINPLEDFAITFAERFQRTYEGFTRAFVNPVEKFNAIEQFLGS